MASRWDYLAGREIKEAFGETMHALARENDLLTVVVSDYGRRLNLGGMREEYPEAFVQCGIAEQGQIEVAASLANEGFHVISPAYAVFSTTRSLDQIRILLGTMESPVCVVGISSGYESSALGSSHVAVEDIAVTRTIPNMCVVCPSDNISMASVLEELTARPRPAYVRISGSLPDSGVHKDRDVAPIGKACTLRDDSCARVAILVTGVLTGQALEAAELLAEKGVPTRVVEFATVKPLDTDALDACREFELVVTVEEHSVLGGFGSAVAEHFSEMAGSPHLVRLGTPDSYPVPDLPRPLLTEAGLLADGIAARILRELGQ